MSTTDDAHEDGEDARPSSARDDDELLPFDVEIERLPAWSHAASAGVVVVGVLVATHVVPMLAFLPLLVVSSLGRRFSFGPLHVEVDAQTLKLGGRDVPRDDVLDVWLDGDPGEARVVVAVKDGARGAELAVMHFQNREQAQRFSGAMGPGPVAVAGHAPRPVDALPSLRFAALAIAFFGTGSWFGLLALAFFALGAFAWLRARQVVAGADGFDVRLALGSTTRHRYAEVETVDVDAGVVTMRGGSEIVLGRAAIRDTTLTTPAWVDRARTRVLARIARASGA